MTAISARRAPRTSRLWLALLILGLGLLALLPMGRAHAATTVALVSNKNPSVVG